MTSSAPTVGRPADRTRHIVHELRSRIVTGALAPGSQLPTRAEMEETFGAGATTVQRALEHLRRDGFVEVNGRQGTYVVEAPPHLTNYALVFPSAPDVSVTWPRFWSALSREARELQETGACNIAQYYGVGQTRNSEDFKILLQEVAAHRLAGIIFATDPFLVDDTPVVTESGIQRVAIMAREALDNCGAVSPDPNSFWERATAYLAQRGRKRVAVLIPGAMLRTATEPFGERLARAGLCMAPYWLQGLDTNAPELAANAAHLLFHGNQVDRPDALIIADDNFLEAATAGLIASGVRVPDDVEVVAHCNFPWPTPSTLPVKRLGYDARQVLGECVLSLKSQAEGAAPTSKRLNAVFDDEVLASRLASRSAEGVFA